MTEFLQLLVLGMATGGFYTINALGLIVVFRSSGIINFASGGTAMIGGYVEWQLRDQWGWSVPMAVLGAMASAAVVGLIVYLLVIRALSAAATLTKVIGTLAVLVSLQQIVILTFGGLSKVPTPFLPTASVRIGSLRIGEDSVVILAATAALTCGLWATYRWTRFGLATSGLAEAPRSLAALGWNIKRLQAANWAVGGALSGLAGAALGPVLQLTPGTFTDLLIPTLASAMIGGLKSFPMTLLGGLIVGGAQAEATRYITWNGSGDAVPFLLIIFVLIARGHSLPLRSFVHERLPRVGTGEIRPARVATALSVVVILALLVKTDWVIGATMTVMIGTVLLSQVVITGYTGQLSLAQLTIAGVGAIAAANLAAAHNVPFLISLVVGMLAVIPVSVLVGLPSLRARGVSLAIATLGLAVAINSVVLTNSKLTGGLSGLTVAPQSIFGWSINPTLHPRRYFFVALTVFVLLALAVCNVRRGRTGRRLLAVRNNERAAKALGIDVVGSKLYGFTLAGIIAAAGGVLLVFDEALPQFSGFDPLAGLSNLVGVVLGGVGFVPGALLGGMFNNNGLPNAILNPYVGSLSWWTEFFPLFTGVALILQLAVNPDGIAGGLSPTRRRRFGRPAAAGALRRPTIAASAAVAGSAATRSAPTFAAMAPSADTIGAASPNAASPNAASPRAGFSSPVALLSSASRRRAAGARRRAANLQELDSASNQTSAPRGSSLVARGLRVNFGSVVALDGVDIAVEPGTVLAIIGPNGAGKTTLLDAITGFIRSSGTVELAGRRIEGMAAHRRARAGLARSFQSLELFDDMTVMDNLRCACDPQDRRSLLYDIVRPGRSTLTATTAAAIDFFGLRDKLDRLPTEIGYGDRRLVAIARALAGSPAVLLLDEPAAGLSEFERVEVARMITAMAREWQIAVVLIEHDVNLVRQVSDHVIALDFGRVIMSGTPTEVLSHPDVISAYLGTDDAAVSAYAEYGVTPTMPADPAATPPGPEMKLWPPGHDSDLERSAAVPTSATSKPTAHHHV